MLCRCLPRGSWLLHPYGVRVGGDGSDAWRPMRVLGSVRRRSSRWRWSSGEFELRKLYRVRGEESTPLGGSNVVAEGMCCHACQIGGAQSIDGKVGAGVGVCLILTLCHVGANPYGLAGLEIRCLGEECHGSGRLVLKYPTGNPPTPKGGGVPVQRSDIISSSSIRLILGELNLTPSFVSVTPYS